MNPKPSNLALELRLNPRPLNPVFEDQTLNPKPSNLALQDEILNPVNQDSKTKPSEPAL